MDFDAYVEEVRTTLVGAGLILVGHDEPDVALRAHRRQVKATRFGFVHTVVTVSHHRPSADADEFRTFAERALRPALKLSGPLPRGLGSSLVAYPVLVVDQASPELRQFVAEYAPKHWAALEFPVVVELVSNSLIVLEKTPLWGVGLLQAHPRGRPGAIDPHLIERRYAELRQASALCFGELVVDGAGGRSATTSRRRAIRSRRNRVPAGRELRERVMPSSCLGWIFGQTFAHLPGSEALSADLRALNHAASNVA